MLRYQLLNNKTAKRKNLITIGLRSEALWVESSRETPIDSTQSTSESSGFALALQRVPGDRERILALALCVQVQVVTLRYVTLTLRYVTSIESGFSRRYVTLLYITLRYVFQDVTLHYITLHYVTLHYVTLRYD